MEPLDLSSSAEPSPQQMARQYFIRMHRIPHWQIYVVHPLWASPPFPEPNYPSVVMCGSLAPSNAAHRLGEMLSLFFGAPRINIKWERQNPLTRIGGAVHADIAQIW